MTDTLAPQQADQSREDKLREITHQIEIQEQAVARIQVRVVETAELLKGTKAELLEETDSLIILERRRDAIESGQEPAAADPTPEGRQSDQATGWTVSVNDPGLTADLWVLKPYGVTDAIVGKLNGLGLRTVYDLENYMRAGSLRPKVVKGLGELACERILAAQVKWRDTHPFADPVDSQPVAGLSPLVLAMVEHPRVQPANQAAYDAGCEARLAGDSAIMNPFERGTEKWIQWDSGFQDFESSDDDTI